MVPSLTKVSSRFFLALLLFSRCLAAKEADLPLPKIELNAQPAHVTVQDLSGFLTRPLRLLVRRNNQARADEFMQVYALGVGEGDELQVDLTPPQPGFRATVFKIVRKKGGIRVLTMPVSHYFGETEPMIFKERIEPSEQEFLLFVYEKTDSPDQKNEHIQYFESRERQLFIEAYRTNLWLSSLKLKLREVVDGGQEELFDRDAQKLIDCLVDPKRIFLIRLWPIVK